MYVDILVIWPVRIPLPLFITRLLDAVFPTSETQDVRPTDPTQATDRKESGHHQQRRGRIYFTLGLETAPVIGVLLLLASTCIPGSVIADGIVGSEGVRPYDIMTLFISFVSPIAQRRISYGPLVSHNSLP